MFRQPAHLRWLFIAVLFFSGWLASSAHAQEQQLFTGRVFDKKTKKPLREVQVLRKDSVVVTSNNGGFFQVTASSGDTLQLQRRGYEAMQLQLPADATFQLGLEQVNIHRGFPGGVAFYEHLSKNLEFPSKAASKKIQAEVYIVFEVNPDGKATVLEIMNDPSGLFTKNTQKVFEETPGKWSSDLAGKRLILPVRYLLKSLDTQPDALPMESLVFDGVLNEIILTAYR